MYSHIPCSSTCKQAFFTNLKKYVLQNHLTLTKEINDKEQNFSYAVFPFKDFGMADSILNPGDKKEISLTINEETLTLVFQDKLELKRPNLIPTPKYISLGKIKNKQLNAIPIVTFYSTDFKKAYKSQGNPISFKKASSPELVGCVLPNLNSDYLTVK